MTMETCSRTVTVTNRHGLHVRPANVIVKTARKYEAQVTIRKGGQIADATSIFDLLLLEATQGTELLLSATGRQAKDAVKALARQFDAEFGVDYKD